ncbi:MAG: AAA-like domain-containing protein [Saprospiraceae bacterium]|nr:AAA-like domain-containing protein [Saprospiraceae bacterium]
MKPEITKKNIYISHSSRSEDDIMLVNYIAESLQADGLNVFHSDTTSDIGKEWADQIDEALNICDYFILVISNESMLSDMVLEEVRRAKKQKDLNQKPEIIPIRLKVPANLELPYTLSAYIPPIQRFTWRDESDNKDLIHYLKNIINISPDQQKHTQASINETLATREQIKLLIANGKIEQAFALLSTVSPHQETIQLQALFSVGKKNFNLGKIDFGEWQRIQSIVIAGILEILDEPSSTYKDFNNFSPYILPAKEPLRKIEPRLPFSSADPWINDYTANRNFYVERPEDEKCKHVVFRPYSILRIKAPRQYGKTMLLSHLILAAKKINYTPVLIDFQLFSEAELLDLERLLKLICATASEQLKLPEKVGDYWAAQHRSQLDKMFQYFDEYLLKKHHGPILFAIDKADKLFKYSNNTTDFFGMLRSWHETSKNTNDPKWKNFSMIITYSTDDIPIEDLNRSFFNVGQEIVLNEFEPEQVLFLAKAHGLNWRFDTAKKIHDLLGGHPYLVKRALYEISDNNYSVETLIEHAISDDGPFSDHLKRMFFKIIKGEGQRRLEILKNIMETGISDNYQECMYFKALGLIKSTNHGYALRSELYRSYFQSKMSFPKPPSFLSRLFKLLK